jgi:hypothetical protein
LEELEVEIDCRLMTKRVEKFARMPKLKKLKLKLYDCEWISPDAFDHLTSIHSVEFDFGRQLFKTFETGLVPCSLRFNHDLKTLIKLNSKNVSRIEKIKFAGFLSSGSNIESLMPLTGLKTLEIGPTNELSFLQMTNLEHLFIYKINRDLSFLNNGRLACLHNLIFLKLQGQHYRASLICINGELFNGLTSLKKLSINYFDTLTRIETGAFNHLTNLLELDLGHNSIEAIEPDTFAHLSKLKVLNISDNKLTQFSSNCFHELPNLEELILYFNKIESIPSFDTLPNDEKAAKKNMSRLRMLSFDSNPLKLLPRNAFASFPALVFLSLKNCQIKELEKGSLDGGLVNLRFLSLACNEFSSLDLSVFDSAEFFNLIYLVLASSSLTSVTNSSVTEPDTFLAKCLNQVVVIVYPYNFKDYPLLNSLSKKGKIELISKGI